MRGILYILECNRLSRSNGRRRQEVGRRENIYTEYPTPWGGGKVLYRADLGRILLGNGHRPRRRILCRAHRLGIDGTRDVRVLHEFRRLARRRP
ncbi:hypothetical protein D3C72_1815580 [compost metagenome]